MNKLLITAFALSFPIFSFATTVEKSTVVVKEVKQTQKPQFKKTETVKKTTKIEEFTDEEGVNSQ